MKLVKWFTAALICIAFVSCLEINEDVQINSNGSGNITTVMDLGQLMT